MRPRLKTTLLWVLALLITLASAAYQKRTGPTYHLRGGVEVAGNAYEFDLPRSHGGDGDAPVFIIIPDGTITGQLSLRRYKSNDEWTISPMERRGDTLTGALPHQPPAGKIMYTITLASPDADSVAVTDEPVVLRFKGDVPLVILIPHVIFMFIAMMLSTRTGLEALASRPRVVPMTMWTLGLLCLGGMILGPIVQKYAFGSFWTGWPYGYDLTDNKTLIAFLAWLAAAILARYRRSLFIAPIIAAIVLLAVYVIPHSVLGSELDYTNPEQSTSVGP
jgi:hypothetical protein